MDGVGRVPGAAPSRIAPYLCPCPLTHVLTPADARADAHARTHARTRACTQATGPSHPTKSSRRPCRRPSAPPPFFSSASRSAPTAETPGEPVKKKEKKEKWARAPAMGAMKPVASQTQQLAHEHIASKLDPVPRGNGGASDVRRHAAWDAITIGHHYIWAITIGHNYGP